MWYNYVSLVKGLWRSEERCFNGTFFSSIIAMKVILPAVTGKAFVAQFIFRRNFIMACFLVPAAEAIVTTVVSKTVNSKKSQAAAQNPFARKLKWLSKLLWGGSALLAFEHVWHGEVIPFPPFLTAAANPANAAEMLHEMATSGVAMAVLVTAVWVGMVIVSGIVEKRNGSYKN